MSRTQLDHAWVPAANFGERRDGKRPDLLLLHYTGMESAEVSLERLVAADSGVSCHYLVDEVGRVTQMVDENKRAWHAGKACWKGENDINSCSIGIEIQNIGHNGDYPAFAIAQMEAVVALCHDIIGRHGIAAERVLGHSDVSPGRKLDPGEKFDWAMLHAAGIGHWVEPVAISGGVFVQRGDSGAGVGALQRLLQIYGYGIEVSGEFDDAMHDVLAAFQRHFRPQRVDGVADHSTVATLKALLDAMPSSPIA